MDMESPYQRAERDLNNINQDNHYMDNPTAPPPAYNGVHNDKTNMDEPLVTQQPTVVTVNSSMAAPSNMPIIPQPVGPNSALMTCPHCRCRIKTRISHKATAKTHIACLLLSWTCICCCLPYCMDSCRNTNHFCPMCGAFLGTYAS